ncbi:pilus assembly protein PilE [Psychromonas marina]|uniref:Pilus assembly protein PilE n=1 Tax=Psychromonas marina TaxID=88364 RepID=A0ABQ6E5A8_9GAMM|nr:type IV pilin protein [Psychromonas marina]GLS92591.1 pilus assembly protein PilE [Psychromonas marina]
MKTKRGFTLIELLIVIAIIGILVSVAYPTYQDSMKRGRRADAQGALQGLAQAMERNYTTQGTYAGAATGGADTGAPAIFSSTSPIDGGSIYYNLRIASAGASSYLIGAEPVGSQAGDGVLILKSTGARGWDANNTANGSLANLSASPNEVEVSEQCWKDSC